MSDPDAPDNDERDGNGPESPGGARSLPSPSPAPAPPQPGGHSLFHIYKPGQGAILRWGTAVGAGLIALAGAAFLNDQLAWFPETVRTLVPLIVLVAAGVGIFHLVGQRRGAVEFLIATEGEMKKVNWSTRKEVIGSTKVVIVTLLAMGLILFLVDVAFMMFFSAIKVLKVDVFQALFGGGGQ